MTGSSSNSELPVLHRLRVVDVDRPDEAVPFGLELVEELHRLDQAERLTCLDDIPDCHEGGGPGVGCPVEDTGHRRLDAQEPVSDAIDLAGDRRHLPKAPT